MKSFAHMRWRLCYTQQEMSDTPESVGIEQGLWDVSFALLSRSPVLRYLLAIVLVALAALFRLALTDLVGPGLPTYITYYPAVMVTAILAGFWPGILATVLSVIYVIVWVLPPYGALDIANPVDAVGVVLFIGMGVLMSAVAQLYQRTRERATAKLAALNADLLRRTNALERSNNELEAFSYSVAHDLRTPLRSIDGFSRYLQEHAAERLTVQEQEYFQRIRVAAQRMARLIDDLLSLARIMRVPLNIETIDLSAMATEIAAGLRKRDPDRTVSFEITPGMVAKADREFLRTALTLLLDNAWKFTGTREQAHISVGMLRQDDRPVYFVRDNGVGFDATYIDKLFQPFQRLHTEEEFPGTGIGLALVQRIVQRLGGRIWAESTIGQGATFYFTLGEDH